MLKALRCFKPGHVPSGATVTEGGRSFWICARCGEWVPGTPPTSGVDACGEALQKGGA